MDNVQKHNICIVVPSPQTFRSYLDNIITITAVAMQQADKQTTVSKQRIGKHAY
jgi:hypothetical protein